MSEPKTINQKFIAELEEILAKAKAGDAHGFAGIIIRTPDLSNFDLRASEGINRTMLIGMVQKFNQMLLTGVL